MREKREMERMFKEASKIEEQIVNDWDEKEKQIKESERQFEEIRKLKRKKNLRDSLTGKNTGTIISFVIGFFLISFGFYLNSLTTEVPTTSDTCLMAEQFVEKRLKSPSSADFSWCSSDNVTKLGDNRFRVSGSLDASNSFNVKLRSRYTVVIKYLGNNEWRLETVNLD